MGKGENSSEFQIISQTEHDGKNEELEELWEDLAGPYAEAVSFAHILKMVQESGLEERVPASAIIQALTIADTNSDGLLQKAEFMNFMERRTGRPDGVRWLIREAVQCTVPQSQRHLQWSDDNIEYFDCRPPPIFIPTVSIIQIAVFIYYAVDMDLPIGAMSPCPTYSPLVYDPARRYEAWRYLSYMLIHSGYMHLVGNLLTQLLFGLVLEVRHKAGRISIIYMAGVFCGALSTSVSAPGFFLAGASGGVYAIQYAHLGNLIINWNELKRPLLQAIFIGMITVADMAYSIYDTFFVEVPSHTAHLAHTGGAICGLLLGICVLRNMVRHPWEVKCQIASIIIFTILVSIAVLVNIFNTDYFPPNDYSDMSDLRINWMAQQHQKSYILDSTQ